MAVVGEVEAALAEGVAVGIQVDGLGVDPGQAVAGGRVGVGGGSGIGDAPDAVAVAIIVVIPAAEAARGDVQPVEGIVAVVLRLAGTVPEDQVAVAVVLVTGQVQRAARGNGLGPVGCIPGDVQAQAVAVGQAGEGAEGRVADAIGQGGGLAVAGEFDPAHLSAGVVGVGDHGPGGIGEGSQAPRPVVGIGDALVCRDLTEGVIGLVWNRPFT